jgi:hypothetical protein
MMGEIVFWVFAVIGMLTVGIPAVILLIACIAGAMPHPCHKRTHPLDYCDRCINDPKFREQLKVLGVLDDC